MHTPAEFVQAQEVRHEARLELHHAAGRETVDLAAKGLELMVGDACQCQAARPDRA